MSIASLLNVEEATDKKGKPYYKYEILTRTGSPLPSAPPPFSPASTPGGALLLRSSPLRQRHTPDGRHLMRV